MAKYQVVLYYTVAKTYVVEADNEQDASDSVSNGSVPPETIGGEEFSDEIIEKIDWKVFFEWKEYMYE